MLEEEAKLLENMQHPNIIGFQYYKKYDNYAILALELSNWSLRKYVNKRKERGDPLREEECAKIMQGIFKGVQYLHDEMDLIHRDMKPENLLMASRSDLSKVKIIDFGLAINFKLKKLEDEGKGGTLKYMPPEQADNEAAYGRVSLCCKGLRSLLIYGRAGLSCMNYLQAITLSMIAMTQMI